jgi:cation diffusion facilitator CzcD-associated flavoprotein CzcO
MAQDPTELAKIEAKYTTERDKRLEERPQGEEQWIDTVTSEKWAWIQKDPWIHPDDHTKITVDISKTAKYLIVGGGYSGLLFAVRLIETGVKPEEIVITDSAGGYGGVWYWNRYPGIMCDVEGYIYMPLLEETAYMPKHKYSYGPELRGHADRIADKWGLRQRTIFRQHIKAMDWDANKNEWVVRTEFTTSGRKDLDLTIRAKYVLLAGGQLTHPKVPVVEGLDKFDRHMFHTSRWDYDYTGGSSTDSKPELHKLKDKTIAIIGTGATAIQAVPELAKYAKHLYVVQRTPSSVDIRGQRETDTEWWKEMTSKKGWWGERNRNYADILGQKSPPPAANLVADQWTIDNPSYCTAWGYDGVLTPDKTAGYVENLHAKDLPRAERIRQRVEDIIQDKETAQKLKHWYPTWCKRPCFHDDYLPAFNQANVTLIDTDGHGVDRFTEKGVVVAGKEYEIDCLILSTGYKTRGPSPTSRFDVAITGKDGIDMDLAFQQEVSTLHGLVRAGFPNLFFSGVAQASLSGNIIYNADFFAKHVAYVLHEAQRQGGDATIESTRAGEDAWGAQVAAHSLGLSGMGGCTPSYLNGEGALDKIVAEAPPEVQTKMMRGQIWGRGVNHYVSHLRCIMFRKTTY